MGFVADIFSPGGTDTYGDAARVFQDIALPDYARQESELRQLLATNQITPEQYDAVKSDPSLLLGYKGDPRLVQAQMNALQGLQDVASEGGLTAADRARLGQIAREEAGIERGAREAILQRAQERGAGGSGLELAAQLIAGQEAAGRRSARGADTAARAEERALQAMMGAGQLGGDIRQQAFSEEAAKAAAQDAINKFNAQNLQAANRENVMARNIAQEQNIARRFDTQRDLNQIYRQRFDDEMRRAAGQTGQMANQAAAEEERRKSGAQFAGGAAAAGLAALAMSDETLKENVEPVRQADIDEFVKSLDFKEYDYKDDKWGKGRQVGFMAQDLEKTKIGKAMVEETPEGKAVNYAKGQAAMLGILKNLTDRVEGIENAGS